MKQVEIKVSCSECGRQQVVKAVIGRPQTIVCLICGTTYGLEVVEVETKKDKEEK